MKKILLLATILVALCSCEPIPANVQERTSDQAMCDFDRIRHFTYKGHKYISFEESPDSKFATLAIVHDPNCGCNK